MIVCPVVEFSRPGSGGSGSGSGTGSGSENGLPGVATAALSVASPSHGLLGKTAAKAPASLRITLAVSASIERTSAGVDHDPPAAARVLSTSVWSLTQTRPTSPTGPTRMLGAAWPLAWPTTSGAANRGASAQATGVVTARTARELISARASAIRTTRARYVTPADPATG